MDPELAGSRRASDADQEEKKNKKERRQKDRQGTTVDREKTGLWTRGDRRNYCETADGRGPTRPPESYLGGGRSSDRGMIAPARSLPFFPVQGNRGHPSNIKHGGSQGQADAHISRRAPPWDHSPPRKAATAAATATATGKKQHGNGNRKQTEAKRARAPADQRTAASSPTEQRRRGGRKRGKREGRGGRKSPNL